MVDGQTRTANKREKTFDNKTPMKQPSATPRQLAIRYRASYVRKRGGGVARREAGEQESRRAGEQATWTKTTFLLIRSNGGNEALFSGDKRLQPKAKTQTDGRCSPRTAVLANQKVPRTSKVPVALCLRYFTPRKQQPDQPKKPRRGESRQLAFYLPRTLRRPPVTARPSLVLDFRKTK